MPMPMPRLSCLAVVLLTACESVAPALYRSPEAEPVPPAPLSWKGTVEGSGQCPTVSFTLTQKERLLEGWATGAGGPHLLTEVRGTIESSDVQVAVDRTLWTGSRSGDRITLQEPSGCRRSVVLTSG